MDLPTSESAAEGSIRDVELPTKLDNHQDVASTATTDDAQQEGENKFQRAISVWREINLTKLVPELDSTATDIVAHQRDSVVARKDLAQKTKDFRKLDESAKLIEYKSLLKSYQTFIDLLTNHGKATSSAFLRIYSSVSEAPDPYPLLEASVDALLTTEDTLPKLSSENEHLQQQIINLTEQLDYKDRELDEERSTRKKLEGTRDSKIQEVEASWKAVLEEKKDNWEAKEKSLTEKVESQERLLTELKASYEVNQRLRDDGSHETPHDSASAAELEIISSDLDRTSQRLAEVEARNEQLRLELAQAASNTQTATPEDDPINARLRSENSALLRKIENARLVRESDTRKVESRIRVLEKDAQNLERDRENLRTKIQSWRDYDEIKQELEIFKSIEFSTVDDDEGGDHAGASVKSIANGATKPQKDSLEQLLLARNKKLSNEMASLRVSKENLQQQLESLQETVSSTNAELERSQNLNATLENDLVRVQQEASNAFDPSAMSTTGTYTTRNQTSSYNASSFPNRKGRSSPTSSIISGFDPRGQSRTTLESIRAGEPVGGGSGIMPMIQAQRDRFKQKNSQLEEELSQQYTIVSGLRQEVASLQKDNLNLYEKSRYVSTYNRGNHSSASAYAPAAQSSSISVSGDTSSGLSLDRYASKYEANLSPFAAFRGRESTRAYKRMSLPERAVFSITRMVLANRMSRNVFAFYLLALHALVFIMLFWMHSVDSSKQVSNLGATAGSALAAGGAHLNPGADARHGDWQQEGFIADPNGT